MTTKWYFTLNAVQISDPNFNPDDHPAGTRPGIVEVPPERCIELESDVAEALDRHKAIRPATKGEITDEEYRREDEGDLVARQTLSAARGMVPASANRAIRQSTGNESIGSTEPVAQTGGGKPKPGKKSPDDGKAGDGDSLL